MDAKQLKNEAEQTISEVQNKVANLVDRSKPKINQFVQKSKKMYAEVKEKLPEDSEKYAAATAVGLTIGYIGYRLGKRQDSSVKIKKSLQSDLESYGLTPFAASVVSPLARFATLWMFYRIYKERPLRR